MRTTSAVGALLALAATLAACEGDAVDNTDRLLDSRTRVLDVSDAVLAELVGALAGRIHSGSGSFIGCGETATGRVDAVRYAVRARVDPGPGAPTPLLASAEAALTEAGFTVEPERDIPQGRSVGGKADDDLSAGISERTGSPWLIVDIAGPCLEVDDDELSRRDPDKVPVTDP